jgi:6-phosphogluconolactonase
MNPFEVEQAPPAPKLPGVALVKRHPDDAIDALAFDLLMQAEACARAFGDFHLALSGGGTPLPLYRRLMLDPRFRQLPWNRTHLWIVDERRVPFTDPLSNFAQIRDIIVDHSGIPASQVHPIEATEPDAAERYEAKLRSILEWRERGQDRLDFVVLGMGADAHTASLFPRSAALRDRTDPPRLVLANDGPQVTPPPRITMTQHLLNASRCLAVLVTGAAKAKTLARVSAAHRLDDPALADELPILSISPKAGELRWYLDWSACDASAAASTSPSP